MEADDQDAPPSDEALETVGGHVRKLRKRRGMTLEGLSEATGISVSSLSRIENTQLGLTLEKIEVLARALGVSAQELVSRKTSGAAATSAASRRPAVVLVDRASQRKESRDREIVAKYLFDDAGPGSLRCIQCTIQPTSIWETEFLRHPGVKIVYVIDGDAIVYCAGKPPTMLERGDAIYMDATVWHSFVGGNGRSVDLLVTYDYGDSGEGGLLETRAFSAESWSEAQYDGNSDKAPR